MLKKKNDHKWLLAHRYKTSGRAATAVMSALVNI